MVLLTSLNRKSRGKPPRRTLLLFFAGLVFVAIGALVVSWKLRGHDSPNTSAPASESRGSRDEASPAPLQPRAGESPDKQVGSKPKGTGKELWDWVLDKGKVHSTSKLIAGTEGSRNLWVVLRTPIATDDVAARFGEPDKKTAGHGFLSKRPTQPWSTNELGEILYYGSVELLVENGQVLEALGDFELPSSSTTISNSTKGIETLTISQSGKSCLAISLPHGPATGDRLVLVYFNPDSGARPEDVFHLPIRNADKAEAKVRKVGEEIHAGFGYVAGKPGHGNVHQISKLANGLYDFVYAENSRGKPGVYVYCDVWRDDQHELGCCATYFRLSDWSIDSPERLEIPLPTPAASSTQKYLLPPVALLHVWLINERVEKLAEGKVTVRRDQKPE